MTTVTTEPPTGLIAMLLCDIEGSTRLASTLGAGWAEILGSYHTIVTEHAAANDGFIDSSAGDGVFVTFSSANAAAEAALGIQRALRDHPWPAAVAELRARMGLHVGHVEHRAHGYVGLEIHRAARVGAAAHGGQLLLTGAAAELTREVLVSQPLGAHRLKDFQEPIALYCAVIDGRGAGDFAAPRTLDLRPGNVPSSTTAPIGRDGDLARVRDALTVAGERSITVLGRGGMGKTTLALEAANQLVDEYPGGAWWVDVTQEHDADGLAAAIARACQVATPGELRAALVADLGARDRALLVLDNLEGVPDAGAFIDWLLERLPSVSVLATSQLPTRGRSERRIQLDSLEPADALALLKRTAERLEVELDDDPACTELVNLLDGLPLAIELAAGRLRMFRPADLIQRLSQSTAILLDRGRPERHRSLGHALEWTLGLLDEQTRTLFTALGVFAGPVELDDIEAIVADQSLDVVAALESLLDVALVRRVETGDGRVRFGFPEAVRQEAARRLDEADGERLRRVHALYYRDLTWPLRICEISDVRDIARALRAGAEIQAALDWAWRSDRPVARELALGRASVAVRSGNFQEMSELLERVLQDPGDDPRVADMARAMGASRDSYSGRRGADVQHEELLAELTDSYARLLCLYNRPIASEHAREFELALQQCDEVLAEAAMFGPLAQAGILSMKADVLLEAGRYEECGQTARAARALTSGTRTPSTDRLELVIAEVSSRTGQHEKAFDSYARGLTEAELADDQFSVQMFIAGLIDGMARARRQADLLEVAGIAHAYAQERSDAGMQGLFTFPGTAELVDRTLTELGAPGQARFDAGRKLARGARVKRACVLIYATGACQSDTS